MILTSKAMRRMGTVIARTNIIELWELLLRRCC